MYSKHTCCAGGSIPGATIGLGMDMEPCGWPFMGPLGTDIGPPYDHKRKFQYKEHNSFTKGSRSNMTDVFLVKLYHGRIAETTSRPHRASAVHAMAHLGLGPHARAPHRSPAHRRPTTSHLPHGRRTLSASNQSVSQSTTFTAQITTKANT